MWPRKSKPPLDMGRDKLEKMSPRELSAFLNSLGAPAPELPEDASKEQRNAVIEEILTGAAKNLDMSRHLLTELGLPTMEHFTTTVGVQSRNTNRWILLVAFLTLVVASFGIYRTYRQAPPPQPHSPAAAVTSAAPGASPTTTQAAQRSGARPDR